MLKKNKVRRFETCRCENCGSDPSGRKLLTISEAARFCKVQPNTIGRWLKLGLVDWVYTQGGKRCIYEDSLIRQNLPEDPARDSTLPEAA